MGLQSSDEKTFPAEVAALVPTATALLTNPARLDPGLYVAALLPVSTLGGVVVEVFCWTPPPPYYRFYFIFLPPIRDPKSHAVFCGHQRHFFKIYYYYYCNGCCHIQQVPVDAQHMLPVERVRDNGILDMGLILILPPLPPNQPTNQPHTRRVMCSTW